MTISFEKASRRLESFYKQDIIDIYSLLRNKLFALTVCKKTGSKHDLLSLKTPLNFFKTNLRIFHLIQLQNLLNMMPQILELAHPLRMSNPL